MLKIIDTLRAKRVAVVAAACLTAPVANATIVEFQTAAGNFQVNLYDNATPETVTNFLAYVNNGDYTNAIFHRSVPGFVIQGGGFKYETRPPLQTVPSRGAITNEPEFANLRGTIAMAKIGGDPNSATSQWFFNLADNTTILDGQNGGFTVFGEVMDNGMDVVDAIAALPIYNFGGVISETPLRNYTQQDFDNFVDPDENNFVMINAIVVTDTTVDTAAGLNPPLNTVTNAPPAPPAPIDGGGGGSFGWLSLIGLLLLRRRRIQR